MLQTEPNIVALWLCTDRKLSALVHLWKRFSSMDVINKEIILEGIHLYQNISTVCSNNSMLKLIYIL